ncbi:MAG: tetratricopeptide repeat protein [Pseudomonadota bacterium]
MATPARTDAREHNARHARPPTGAMAFVWLIVLSVVFFALWVALGTRATPLGDMLAEAEALTRAGHYQRAVDHLRAAVRQSPNDGELRVRLGTAYATIGDHHGAAKELERAWSLGHRAPTVLRGQVEALIAVGDAETARRVIHADDAPFDETQVAFLEARIHVAKGDTARAEDAYRRILENDPDHRAARRALEQLQASVAPPDQSQEDARPTQDRGPLTSGDFAGAVSLFRDQLRQTPNDDQLRLLLIEALVGSARLDEATTEAAQLRLEAGTPNSAFAKGLLANANKQWREAEAHANRVLALAPHHVGGQLLRTGAQYQSGAYERSIRNAKQTYAAHPNDLTSLRWLSRNHIALNQLRDAVETIDEARIKTARPTPLSWFADLFLDAASAPTDPAGQQCAPIRALANEWMDSTAPAAFNWPAERGAQLAFYARLRANDVVGAERFARDKSAHQPDHADFYYLRGLALEQLSARTEALSLYQQALVHAPNHVRAKVRTSHLMTEDSHPINAKDTMEGFLDGRLPDWARYEIGITYAQLLWRTGERDRAFRLIGTLKAQLPSTLRAITAAESARPGHEARFFQRTLAFPAFTIHLSRIRTLRYAEHEAALQSALRDARRQTPNAIGTLLLTGASQSRTGQYDDAALSLDAYKQFRPNDPDGVVADALNALHQGHANKAASLLNKLIEREHGHAEGRAFLAALALNAGNPTRAADHYTRIESLDRAPDYVALIGGDIAYAQARFDVAIREYRRYFDAQRRFPNAIRLFAAVAQANRPNQWFANTITPTVDRCRLDAKTVIALRELRLDDALRTLAERFSRPPR